MEKLMQDGVLLAYAVETDIPHRVGEPNSAA
jgi:hypothetical protein